MSDMAMKYEDWLRGCVHHDGRKGNVYLPCDTVLAIADWIEAHRDAVPATIEGTLDYLHKVGWMQEHDRIMTEDVAPVRHGRWKPFDRTWGRSVFTCTACGDAMDVPTEMGEPIFDYCPNCGAKMDEEKRDDED